MKNCITNIDEFFSRRISSQEDDGKLDDVWLIENWTKNGEKELVVIVKKNDWWSF